MYPRCMFDSRFLQPDVFLGSTSTSGAFCSLVPFVAKRGLRLHIVDLVMRVVMFVFATSALFAQQPILYHRGTVNAASLAPFGLPNAPIARGSVFTVFGEKLGPAQSPALSFPLSATLGGVSIGVTQSGVTTQAYPIFVSASQINAVMPSTVTAGLATLRLTYLTNKSNAITIQIANSGPGIFAISSGGYGPGVVMNYVAASNQPVNSLTAPAAPGQVITIWGTGLGPVTFPDNVAPTAGNVATLVTLTIGGKPATVAYSGRAPCCSGIDQIVATVPKDAPLGCWVPVSINAGGVVSNTPTMAIAAPGATSCDDPGNPLSKLVRTPGTQAFIHLEQVDTIDNINTTTPITKTLQEVYSRFYTRPDSPYNFDPYMSYPPSGTCLVHQTSGDSSVALSLRGALPASASLSPQPHQTYHNGTQSVSNFTTASTYQSIVGGTVDSIPFGLNPLSAGASFTIDPAGANQMVFAINPEPPPAWTRPNAKLIVPRNAPLALTFTPGDTAAPTAILLYAYSAATNSTAEVQCLAPPGAGAFTISADTLANLPSSHRIIDGSYANLFVGTLGVNHAISFMNADAATGILLNSTWLSQSVVLQ
jgi:uncharacterized protein (TIGR03437 family)